MLILVQAVADTSGTGFPEPDTVYRLVQLSAAPSAASSTAQDWTALLVALGGLAVAAFGAYLGYRGRTTAARDRLHAEQVALLSSLAVAAYEGYIAALRMISTTDREERKKILNTDGNATRELQRLGFHAAALLPTRVFETLHTFVGVVTATVSPQALDKMPNITDEVVRCSYWDFIATAREELGIDALSSESKSLFRS